MTEHTRKIQHLERDVAMGWLILQDAPQAKVITDYIDRLRVIAREALDARDGLEEQLEAQRPWRLYKRMTELEEQFQTLEEKSERQATNIGALYRQRRDAELACELSREENTRLIEQLEARDRWDAFTHRETQDMHHALRMFAKYPGLSDEEAAGYTALADEIWDRHAAQTADAYPASEGVAGGLQASAVPAATPPFVVEQNNSNPAGEPS